jgi:hypothetical protein
VSHPESPDLGALFAPSQRAKEIDLRGAIIIEGLSDTPSVS